MPESQNLQIEVCIQMLNAFTIDIEDKRNLPVQHSCRIGSAFWLRRQIRGWNRERTAAEDFAG